MNKQNIRNVIIYVCITIAAIAISLGVYTYISQNSISDGTITYSMYYVDKSSKQLDIEERMVNYVDDDPTMFNTVIDEFSRGPSSTNQKLTLPSGFKIKSSRYSGMTAYIDLEESYNSLSDTDRILSLGALVYTVTDMSFIDDVMVSVNGKPVLNQSSKQNILLNRQNVRNNPVMDPEKTEWQTITLYFCDRSGSRLLSEQRSIEVKKSMELEYQIVEQLIIGPDKKMLKSTVPDDTEIRDIKTEDGICYVNLSKDFLDYSHLGINSQLITIYSVVNSLTELSSVDRVQFLIEGEKVNKTIENMDFSKPFSRNIEQA